MTEVKTERERRTPRALPMERVSRNHRPTRSVYAPAGLLSVEATMTEARALLLKIKHLMSTINRLRSGTDDLDTVADLIVQFARHATTPAERALAQRLERVRQERIEQRARIEAEYEAELTEAFQQADDDIREWAEQTWRRSDDS